MEKAYEGELTCRLGDILEKEIVADNPKISDIKENFPAATMLTGVLAGERLILVEGMHRSTALAALAAEGRLPTTAVAMALTAVAEGELAALGKGK